MSLISIVLIIIFAIVAPSIFFSAILIGFVIGLFMIWAARNDTKRAMNGKKKIFGDNPWKGF